MDNCHTQILPRIRRSARAFARAPGLSLVLVLTIALGVGTNAAVYGFIEGLTHPSSPIRDTDRIVSIFQQDRSREAGPLTMDEYQQLKDSRGVFEWIGAARIRPAEAVIDGRSEMATVADVTQDLAGALALPLDKGAVISYRIWESEYVGRDKAIGSHVRIDNLDLTVVGVASEHLDGLYSDQSVDLWIQSRGQNLGAGGDRRNVWALGRLRQGISLAYAQTALGSGSAGLRPLNVRPFTGIAPNTVRGLALVGMFLDFSAAAVFFIACINVASFLLGRAFRRSHETSLRIALGATRAELVRELFADSVVLSVAGGTMGLLLGILTAHALPAFLFEGDAERLSFAPQLLPIFTASLVCIVATAICGMMPVLGTVTDRPWMVLQRESGSPSKTLLRLRSTLVVGQIATCCMLVLCTALLLNGLHSALKTSAGHRMGNPVLLTVQAPTRPDGPEIDPNYFSEVEQRARSIVGLSPLAWMSRMPGNQPKWRTFMIQSPSLQYRDAVMDIAWLTPDSLQMLDSQPTAGRMFGVNDPGRRVGVVNEVAAAELFGKKTVGMVIRDSADLPIEIIGVVQLKSDAKPQSRPTIYYGYLDQAEAPYPVRPAHFRIPKAPLGGDNELSAKVVSANYFRAFDIPVIAGRMFSSDLRGEGQRTAVINQEAADLYFNGKALGADVIDDRGVRTQVIGVVRSQVFGTFEQHAEPTIYFPMGQDPVPRMTLMLKDSQWNNAIATDLRHKVESVSRQGSASIAITTLDKQLAQSGLAPLRIATLIGSVSAAIALMLSILGLISAQSDAERQLQPERALRIALGAQRWHIVLMVMANVGRLAVIGTAIGESLSFPLLRLLAANITGIASPPLGLWLIAPFMSAAMVTLASMFPAWRASVISPLTIMRDR
jgi:ABC-type antimicrobial peptide transport system permease subunit